MVPNWNGLFLDCAKVLTILQQYFISCIHVLQIYFTLFHCHLTCLFLLVLCLSSAYTVVWNHLLSKSYSFVFASYMSSSHVFLCASLTATLWWVLWLNIWQWWVQTSVLCGNGSLLYCDLCKDPVGPFSQSGWVWLGQTASGTPKVIKLCQHALSQVFPKAKCELALVLDSLW
jgi:hypothetical protein